MGEPKISTHTFSKNCLGERGFTKGIWLTDNTVFIKDKYSDAYKIRSSKHTEQDTESFLYRPKQAKNQGLEVRRQFIPSVPKHNSFSNLCSEYILQ